MTAPSKAAPAKRRLARNPAFAPAFRRAASPAKISSASPAKTTEKTPAKKPISMRRYAIRSLLDDGSIRSSDHIGPAIPSFEAAFSAFAHGTLIATPGGQVAIEDLEPGMRVETTTHGPQEIVWIGAMTLVPRSADLPQGGSLTRITADSFGLARPERDLLTGPGARIRQNRTSQVTALVPVSTLADGQSTVEVIPPRPVTVYHICLRQHALIKAGGLESESYHPGIGFETRMSAPLLSLFLSFFPHIDSPEDFGPLAMERRPFDTQQHGAA